jgi:hypothetical protein
MITKIKATASRKVRTKIITEKISITTAEQKLERLREKLMTTITEKNKWLKVLVTGTQFFSRHYYHYSK